MVRSLCLERTNMPAKRRVDADELLVNGFDLTVFRKHPRVIELRVLVLFNVLIDEYGIDKATNFFRSFAELSTIEWNRISGILNSFYTIKRLERADLKRYRQEVLFMGLLWGDARFYAATHYLKISKTTLYSRENELNPSDFIDQAWLDELSNEVTICGQEAYKIEGIRFLEALHHLTEVLGNVSVPS